jgi:hypothetical protein
MMQISGDATEYRSGVLVTFNTWAADDNVILVFPE